MRLQLSIALLFLMATPMAYADGRAATWLEVYDDDDDLNVISSQLSMRAEASENLELSASYEIDVISAATVDVVTAASPRGYEENRHGLSFGARWELAAGTSLSATYLPTWENDYRSQSFVAGFSREWVDRRLTTSVGARLSLDSIGRSGSDTSSFQDADTVALSLGLGWVATRFTVLQVTYEPQRTKGFQSSSYRFVNIHWNDDTTALVAEAVPNLRTRHAMAFAVRHALHESWFLSGYYRLYLDDWGIVSHTGETELQHALDWDKVLLGLSLRGYRQGAAEFQKNRYEAMAGTLPAYRSADKMLAQSWSLLAAARAEFSLADLDSLESLRLVAKVEVYDQHFIDFQRIQGRFAKTAALGISAEF